MRLDLTVPDWKQGRRLNTLVGRWNARKWSGYPAGTLTADAVTTERLGDGRYVVRVELREGDAAGRAESIDFADLLGRGRLPRRKAR